jgi:CHASE2 domain-containing sensor protein
MRVTLVGKRRNRRAICWSGFFKLTVLMVLAGTLLATGAYLLLVQRWNPQAPLAGAGAGLVTSLITLVANLFTPLYRLPILGD